MQWADAVRTLVRANAGIPRDAVQAMRFGAQGIGLCRTEHMFFEEARLPIMQKMIVSDTVVARRAALDELFVFQKDDFKGLFKEMKGQPVTVPLDRSASARIPAENRGRFKELSKKIGISADKIWQKAKELHEFNPMLGHRGCKASASRIRKSPRCRRARSSRPPVNWRRKK